MSHKYKKTVLLIFIITIIVIFCSCGNNQGNASPEKPVPEKDDYTLYGEFLRGEARLYGDKFENSCWSGDDYTPSINLADGLTLGELVYKLKTTLYTYSPMLTEINSAYIDCGRDGIPEMAVEIVFSDEYDEILIKEVIIKDIDGRLQLCYITESYYRYYEHLINNDGLIASGGSSGATSYAEGYGVIDADGQYHDIYNEYGEYYLGAYYPERSNVQSVASNYTDEINDTSLLRIITFYDKNGNAEEPVYGADPEDDDLTVKIFDEAATKLTGNEEIENLIKDHFNLYTVSAEEETLGWKAADLEAAGLADVVKYGFNPVFVSSVDEFVAAIDDDVTIILAPGTYNLTQWMNDHNTALEEYCEQNAETIKGACNTVYGDFEFGIANISGMTIVSQDKDNPAQIVSEPRYCHVINFAGSNSNRLTNLVIGHTTEQGSCCGDVVAFNESYNNKITGCDIFGCGAYGIYVNSCGDNVCEDTVIHDCTYGLLEAYSHSYISFNDCIFKSCEGYSMIDLSESDAYFQDCFFSNLNADMLSLDANSYVTFSNCMFDAACANSINTYAGNGTVNIY